MGRYGAVNYERWAKMGFLMSLAVLAVGAGGELAASAMHLSLPAWEHTLFFEMEVFGTLGILLFPLVFGVVLPLTE
ncbi:DUF7860 family protein [Halorussus amylolyticus]|uniref:DUF7860 family protein n=1 Tax=Halorussus amylolyticus TaxID=1126242 RepID=UPI001051025D|nr:hypothetical protein [Halorussus amylolyticus]